MAIFCCFCNISHDYLTLSLQSNVNVQAKRCKALLLSPKTSFANSILNVVYESVYRGGDCEKKHASAESIQHSDYVLA